MNRLDLALACIALVLVGCSGDRAPPPKGNVCQAGGNGNDGGPITGLSSASSDGTCSDLLKGTKAEGESCSASSECKPVCCACPAGVQSAQVAWCRDGACAPADDACCAFAVDHADGGLICQ